jgi:hypothetical protein
MALTIAAVAAALRRYSRRHLHFSSFGDQSFSSDITTCKKLSFSA